ncbi:hypothetical protein QR680_007241 [Steinernema hermaphroditum]|uniref:Uncharacterized protein n=1 Tax=Steinernema hermaphroditum TaxID=289476 RepID=A0AA39LYT3_9BILA|nr:hypothetical protein QR680_007241 [Steinernema hermaphroditum]
MQLLLQLDPIPLDPQSSASHRDLRQTHVCTEAEKGLRKVGIFHEDSDEPLLQNATALFRGCLQMCSQTRRINQVDGGNDFCCRSFQEPRQSQQLRPEIRRADQWADRTRGRRRLRFDVGQNVNNKKRRAARYQCAKFQNGPTFSRPIRTFPGRYLRRGSTKFWGTIR